MDQLEEILVKFLEKALEINTSKPLFDPDYLSIIHTIEAIWGPKWKEESRPIHSMINSCFFQSIKCGGPQNYADVINRRSSFLSGFFFHPVFIFFCFFFVSFFLKFSFFSSLLLVYLCSCLLFLFFLYLLLFLFGSRFFLCCLL